MTQPWQAEGPRGAESSHPAEAAAGTFRARRMISGLKAAEKSSLPCLERAPPQPGHRLLLSLSRSCLHRSSKILSGQRKHDYREEVPGRGQHSNSAWVLEVKTGQREVRGCRAAPPRWPPAARQEPLQLEQGLCTEPSSLSGRWPSPEPCRSLKAWAPAQPILSCCALPC